MVTDALVPWLRGRFDLPEQGIALKLRFVGIGQSSIDAAFRGRLSLPPDVVVTSEFEGSRVDFTFSLPHAGEESERHLAALAAAAREHLGGHLYATNGASLEEVAVRRLLMREERLTVVEVGGPHLAASLARSGAARTALAGSFAANSEEDLVRLLDIPRATWTASPRPEDRVQRLAEGARASTGSAWVLMVGTPSAAEGDRSVVWVGVGMPNGRWEHWRLVERSNPEAGRTSLVNEILDRLRKLEP
jgi:nicotinamide mononucleotide (NMN) deamidase PncC